MAPKQITMYECDGCGKPHMTREQAAECCPSSVPTMMVTPDIERLKLTLKHYITDLAEGNGHEDDDHAIFEVAVEAFYGKNVWDWINKQM